jgi:hypothetical protein
MGEGMAHSVTISWDASVDAASVAGYAVYRITLKPISLIMSFNRMTDGYLATSTSYTDTTVQPGYTYIYFVTAWTSLHGIMSRPSNVVEVVM